MADDEAGIGYAFAFLKGVAGQLLKGKGSAYTKGSEHRARPRKDARTKTSA